MQQFHLSHEIEHLRRSVAMLSPGEQALDRETALTVLHRLAAVSAASHIWKMVYEVCSPETTHNFR